MIRKTFGKRIRKAALGAVGISFATLLTACGTSSAEVTSIEIDKEGAVTNVIYEEFKEDYLSIDELTSMANKEIEAYNSEYISPRITLGEVELNDDEGFVKLSMTFKSAEDFSNFNEKTVFYGTLEEARQSGYNISSNLVDKGGDAPEDGYVDEHLDNHIVITTDKANFKTPYSIKYMSKGVLLLNDKEAVLQDTTGESVQLLLAK